MDIIANIKSGKGNGEKCLSAVTAYLNANAIRYNVHITERVGHGKQLASELSAAGSPVIVALGGDGTFHEVLNGIDFERSRMGLIPAGRGNDFAIGTGAAPLNPIKAIENIANGVPKDYDYIAVGDKRCINVAGSGLDVEVLLKTARSKNKLSYVASLFRCLLHYKPYTMTVKTGDVQQTFRCIMTGVCNGSQIGSGIRLCPTAKPDDGLLEVIVMEKPKTPVLLVMPGFVKGKHMDKPYTHRILCESVTVDTPAPLQLDGEIYYAMPFEAHIVKGGLKTFANPEQSPAENSEV